MLRAGRPLIFIVNFALAVVVASLAFAPQKARGLGVTPGVMCAALFSTKPVPRIERWPIVNILRPTTDDVPLLDTSTLKNIFTGVFHGGSAGKAAVTYMRTLPVEMPNATKAKIWIELVRYINSVELIIFYSDMYTMPGHRFLFRGGAGESLFIDSDGVMYRTRTVPLERAATWDADYSQFVRIN